MAEPTAHLPVAVSTLRKRAAIDALVGLVITMLAWPFPIARAYLPPVVNVAAVFVTWMIVNMAYHAVCLAVWRTTAGMHLTGLAWRGASAETRENRSQALRWGALAGMLVVVALMAPTVFSAGFETAPEAR